MGRTKTPEQAEAAYNWLTPKEVAERIGVESDSTVRDLIREGHLKPPGVMNVSRSKVPRYRVSEEAVERFIKESERKVRELVGKEG